ncbi:transcription antitermination factor NusB [Oceanibium sediminis]|uniref:transcription antitermination factor NusB n=1 Tax=Oceanibium sediminis TaxID=2026339 RepID=UPI000DD39FB5|nr:transcription antitermination factor NusB [Oceanibium sediminis]
MSTPTKTDKRQQRSTARLFATQALFQMEASDATLDDVREEFETHRFGAEIDGETYAEGDLDLFRALLSGAVERQGRIDKLTDAALVAKWPIARIDPTIRALFRAAGAELLSGKTPPRVVINEFVDVAKAFFPDGRESKFVNAVLDHMARDVNPEAFA